MFRHQLVIRPSSGQSKIGNLDLAPSINQDIRRLDITMDKVVLQISGVLSSGSGYLPHGYSPFPGGFDA
jgi:hypothetical protein